MAAGRACGEERLAALLVARLADPEPDRDVFGLGREAACELIGPPSAVRRDRR